MPPVTQDELTSVTLGSFQPGLTRSYITSMRFNSPFTILLNEVLTFKCPWHHSFKSQCSFFCRRKEVEHMPFVDSDTHDQRLLGMPNPVGYMWDEVHPPAGPPNWDPNLYWPWENVRLLLTYVPSRMRNVPDRAVVLMYRPVHLPPPIANPLGLRPLNLQRLMGYCCGSAAHNACPVGERLVGACSHCATALSLSSVIPANPAAFISTHRGVRLLDRKNINQMDTATLTEVT